MSTTYEIDARIVGRITAVEPPPPGPIARITTTIGGVTITHTGAEAMAYTLRNDQQVELKVDYVDADGNPAAVDGAVQWESSDDAIAHVESTDPDGKQVTLVGESNGNCQIRATADADLGSGTRELITLMDVTIVSGEAVAGVITPVGEAQPKP